MGASGHRLVLGTGMIYAMSGCTCCCCCSTGAKSVGNVLAGLVLSIETVVVALSVLMVIVFAVRVITGKGPSYGRWNGRLVESLLTYT